MAAPNGRETAPEGREALIAELEELGYDNEETTAAWRELHSREQLQEALVRMRAKSLPDISEIVEAIREAVTAADAYHDAHPDEPRTIRDEAGKRWLTAFERLRTLLTEIDTAMEAFS